MKTKTIIRLLLVVTISLANNIAGAQTWTMTGNTNLTAASILGGTSATVAQNFPLRLFTYNAERIHINANVSGKVGYVGIGTTAPNTRLHVNGVITATGGTSTNWNTAYSWGRGWSLTGNPGTNAATNFIGTTDNVALNFRVNNQKAGTIDPLLWNTSFGLGALKSNTIGMRNTAIGDSALQANTEGEANTATGWRALRNNTIGSSNTAYGAGTLESNSTGVSNTAIGVWALHYMGQGGSYNTAIGESALYYAQGGSYNTAVGLLAGIYGGMSSTFLGYHAQGSSTGLTNSTAIGANAYVSTDNSLVLGNNVNVGIGTSAPIGKLDIKQGTGVGVPWSSGLNIYDGGNRWSMIQDGSIARQMNFGGGGFEWWNATGTVALMKVADGGNVGIGTWSPQSKLDISVDGYDAYQGINLTNTRTGGKRLGMNQGSLGKLNFTEPGVIDLMTLEFNTNRVGVNQVNPTYTFEVNGSAGKPGGGSWGATSDARLKQQVEPFNDGLEQIMQIKPIRYHYNEKSGYDTKPEYVGVLAQEIKEVAPYMVGTFTKDNNEYYNVDNSAMTYMLINAVKEQHKQNEEQTAEIKELKALLTQLTHDMQSCCENHGQGLNKSTAQDAAGDVATLDQNTPNPANQSTVIRFYIPSIATNAVIKLMTENGSELKSYSIAEKGLSQLTISSTTLAAGNYLYQLIVDGKTIDTKRMMVTK